MDIGNKAEGAAKVAVGKAESRIGEALGDGEMQILGAGLQIEGRLQEAAGTVQDAFGRAAHGGKAAVSKISGAYGRASDTVHGIADTVADRPFVALAAAGAIGLLAGLLLASPRVIYVKPRA